jgi:hypothetical protein
VFLCVKRGYPVHIRAPSHLAVVVVVNAMLLLLLDARISKCGEKAFNTTKKLGMKEKHE